MTKFNGSTGHPCPAPFLRDHFAPGGSSFSLRCSFANPSGRRGCHERNTNSQFVGAYRLGTQGRDTNARCNQQPLNDGHRECSPRLNPQSTAAEPQLPKICTSFPAGKRNKPLHPPTFNCALNPQLKSSQLGHPKSAEQS